MQFYDDPIPCADCASDTFQFCAECKYTGVAPFYECSVCHESFSVVSFPPYRCGKEPSCKRCALVSDLDCHVLKIRSALAELDPNADGRLENEIRHHLREIETRGQSLYEMAEEGWQ